MTCDTSGRLMSVVCSNHLQPLSRILPLSPHPSLRHAPLSQHRGVIGTEMSRYRIRPELVSFVSKYFLSPQGMRVVPSLFAREFSLF